MAISLWLSSISLVSWSMGEVGDGGGEDEAADTDDELDEQYFFSSQWPGCSCSWLDETTDEVSILYGRVLFVDDLELVDDADGDV